MEKAQKKAFKDMTFEDFAKIDVTPHCDKRKAKDEKGKDIEVCYLNWAKCKQLLHDLGAKQVYFEPVVGGDGSSLIKSDIEFVDKNGVSNRCYEVRVRIVIDDLEFESQFPLMNGSNPVKDNSLTQQRLWNAQTRAFVKGVAIRLGLGFSLWLSDYEGMEDADDLSMHSLNKIRQRFEETYSSKLRMGLSAAEIAKALSMTVDEVKAIFANFDTLIRFEENLKAIKV